MPCPSSPAVRRPRLLWLTALAVGLLLSACGGDTATGVIPRGAILVNVGSRPVTGRLPPGFLGFSIEYPSSIGYSGRDPSHPNPLYLQLVRGLNPGQSPVLRFGGDTADWTWWPVPGMTKPSGIRYTLTPRWLAVTAATARALDARLILGINFEADSRRIASAESRALLDAIGRRYVAGFELGNEPEAYSTLGWYYLHRTVPVLGRRPGYGLAAYLPDYASVRAGLPPGIPLVGPASGAPEWLSGLDRFLRAEPRIAVATFHRYPLHRCATARTSLDYPTIPNLLRPVASSGPATSLATAVAVAHAHHVRFRADEVNSVSCGGARGVSDTFAGALWALDTLFNMDRTRVDGVNIHTFQSAIYAPFAFTHHHGRWLARVKPMYYGLLLFTRAAPPGSRLLPTLHRGPSSLRIWTTRGAGGRERVLVINDSLRRSLVVAVRLPGTSGAATVARLTAPSASSKRGVTLAGQSFGDQTSTGTLSGPSHTTTIGPTRGRFVISLPAASAALLTTAGP
jgi:Glycosyl hydrolase family 79 C-terminal beta domain